MESSAAVAHCPYDIDHGPDIGDTRHALEHDATGGT
jgi:hypothetical protein